MPSLNFKQRFATLIEAGQKRQTIRKLRKRPFRPGDRLFLFTGMRTAQCRRLGTHRCLAVHDIVIRNNRIEVDGQALTADEIEEIARADGFESTEAFFAFFRREHDLPLVGQMICW